MTNTTTTNNKTEEEKWLIPNGKDGNEMVTDNRHRPIIVLFTVGLFLLVVGYNVVIFKGGMTSYLSSSSSSSSTPSVSVFKSNIGNEGPTEYDNTVEFVDVNGVGITATGVLIDHGVTGGQPWGGVSMCTDGEILVKSGHESSYAVFNAFNNEIAPGTNQVRMWYPSSQDTMNFYIRVNLELEGLGIIGDVGLGQAGVNDNSWAMVSKNCQYGEDPTHFTCTCTNNKVLEFSRWDTNAFGIAVATPLSSVKASPQQKAKVATPPPPQQKEKVRRSNIQKKIEADAQKKTEADVTDLL